MTMQTPSLSRALLAVFILLAVEGCEKKPPKFLIGHLAPMSGLDRERGLSAVRGVQLAVETINADKDQFIAGCQVAVVHVDTRSDVSTAENQAVRLATVNKVSTIIGGDTREQMARLALTARDYNLTIVGPAGAAGTATNVFGLGVSLDQRVEAIVKLLNKQQRAAPVLLVVDRRDAGLTAASEQLIEKLRPTMTNIVVVPFKERSEIWPALRRDKIELVLLFCAAGDAAEITKAVSKPQLTIFAGDDAESHLLVAEPAANDCLIISPLPAKPASDADKAFAEKYKNRFGEQPAMEARRYWDAIQVLCAAIRDSKSLNADKILPKLRGIKSGTRLSGNFSMPPEQVARGEVYILQVKDGRIIDHIRMEP